VVNTQGCSLVEACMTALLSPPHTLPTQPTSGCEGPLPQSRLPLDLGCCEPGPPVDVGGDMLHSQGEEQEGRKETQQSASQAHDHAEV
jgi:hypothetical protein